MGAPWAVAIDEGRSDAVPPLQGLVTVDCAPIAGAAYNAHNTRLALRARRILRASGLRPGRPPWAGGRYPRQSPRSPKRYGITPLFARRYSLALQYRSPAVQSGRFRTDKEWSSLFRLNYQPDNAWATPKEPAGHKGDSP